jgi:hypothetical protein
MSTPARIREDQRQEFQVSMMLDMAKSSSRFKRKEGERVQREEHQVQGRELRYLEFKTRRDKVFRAGRRLRLKRSIKYLDWWFAQQASANAQEGLPR